MELLVDDEDEDDYHRDMDMEEDSSSGLFQDFSVEFLRRLPSSQEEEDEEELRECQFVNMRVLAQPMTPVVMVIDEQLVSAVARRGNSLNDRY